MAQPSRCLISVISASLDYKVIIYCIKYKVRSEACGGYWREKKKDKFKKKEYSGEGKQISKVRSLLVIKIILEYFFIILFVVFNRKNEKFILLFFGKVPSFALKFK